VVTQYQSVTDTHTDRQIHDDGMYRASTASRSKNRLYCTEQQVLLPGNERRLIAN